MLKLFVHMNVPATVLAMREPEMTPASLQSAETNLTESDAERAALPPLMENVAPIPMIATAGERTATGGR